MNSDTSDQEPLIIVGASGHAKSVIDVVQEQGTYKIVGLIDSIKPAGEIFFGYEILGAEADLKRLLTQFGCGNLFVAIGENFSRQSVTYRLGELVPAAQFVSLVHPRSVVSRSADIGSGSIVMPGAVVNADAHISEGCIVNTSACIDHDCILEPFSSIAPNVALAGNVTVGARTMVGTGASVNHKLDIGADSAIGAGAVVISNIPSNRIAYGVPCKVVRDRTAEERSL